MPATITSKNPNAVKDLAARYAKLEGLEVAQGWIEGDVDPADVAIAAFNIFGTPNAKYPIPPRDALTPAATETAQSAAKYTAAAARAVNRGQDPRGDLEAFAKVAEIALERSVEAFGSPSNADSTIAAKGFDDPLIGKGSDGGRILDGAGAKVRPRSED